MKHASQEIRELAVTLHKKHNYSIAKTAEIVGYHPNTVKNWLKANREGRSQTPLKRGCPPKVLTPADREELKRLVESGKYHNLSDLTEALGKASRSTIYRAIRELGYTFKKKRYMPAKKKLRK